MGQRPLARGLPSGAGLQQPAEGAAILLPGCCGEAQRVGDDVFTFQHGKAPAQCPLGQIHEHREPQAVDVARQFIEVVRAHVLRHLRGGAQLCRHTQQSWMGRLDGVHEHDEVRQGRGGDVAADQRMLAEGTAELPALAPFEFTDAAHRACPLQGGSPEHAGQAADGQVLHLVDPVDGVAP